MRKVDYSPSFEAITGLEGVPGSVLRALLDQHTAVLRKAGLEPSALTSATALWAHRMELPPDLVEAIHRIHDMADPAGHDQILTALGGPLFAAGADGMPPAAFAAVAMVDHPDLFAQAFGRRFVESTRRSREFPGKLVAEPRVDQDKVITVQSRLSSFFALRSRGNYCRVCRWEEPGGLCFLVSHGGCRRVDDAVEDHPHGSREVSLPWRPRYHDLVVFDPRTGRLRVSSADAPTTQAYLLEFGDILTGDRHWFGNGEVVSLDPLFRHREHALRPTRGLLEVRVVGVELGSFGEDGGSLMIAGENAFRTLDRAGVDPFAFGELRAAKFKLKFASDRRIRTVTLQVPDRVSGDWRRDGGVVRSFFEERGFLAGPPQEPSCLVA